MNIEQYKLVEKDYDRYINRSKEIINELNKLIQSYNSIHSETSICLASLLKPIYSSECESLKRLEDGLKCFKETYNDEIERLSKECNKLNH